MTDLLIMIFAALFVFLLFPYIWTIIRKAEMLTSEFINDVSDMLTYLISDYKGAWKKCIEDVRRFIYGSKKR